LPVNACLPAIFQIHGKLFADAFNEDVYLRFYLP
jgi:hypothetical protein